MKTILTSAALGLIGVVWATRATAEEPELPTRVTLEQLLALFDGHSPRTASLRAAIAVTAAERISAEALPNPTLSYGGVHLLSGTSTGAETQHQWTIEQPLLLFGQRGARRTLAERQVDAETAHVAATLAEQRYALRQAFIHLVARQEQVSILKEAIIDVERIETIVKGRAAAGDRSRYDVARVEVEARTLRTALAAAGADVEDAAGVIATTVGFPSWRPEAAGGLEPGNVPTEPERLWQLAEQQHPALAASRGRERAARAGLAVAQKEAWPVPSVTGGALVTDNAGGVSAVFGLSIPIPLFDRNQGAVARATAEVAAEALGSAADTAETRAQIDRTAQVLVKRRAVVAMMDTEVIHGLPALRTMAENAYREGRGDLLELLDAFRSQKDSRLLHLQLREQAKLAEAEVIFAAGLDSPTPVVSDR